MVSKLHNRRQKTQSEAPAGSAREDECAPGSIPADLDRLFSQWDRSDAPGLIVGVARAGEIIYRRGLGMASLEAGVANAPGTRIRIGSTSKHFTCLLALLLAEEGRLDLDRPVRDYLPVLTGPGGDPTLRQLMQHRGGSRCYLDLAFISHGLALSPLGAALQTQTRQSGRNFAPGTAMIYNNSGYHLLSLVIQKVGNAPFEDQLRDRLFAPLDMVSTASVPSDYDILPGVATLHVPGRNGGWRRGLFPTEDVRGEGAIISTLDDMLRWTAHLRSRDRFGTPRSWADLTTPAPHPSGASATYALGLMVENYRGQQLLHHPGGVMGGSSSMMVLPDHDLDIVILSNGAADADPLALGRQVIDIVLADCLDTADEPVRGDDHADCLGDWWSPATGMLYSLIDKDGIAKLRICGADVSGGTLTMSGDRRAACRELAIGEIGFDLDPGRHGGQMIIGFAGSDAAYERVTPAADISPAFADRVTGRFFSADANATAEISRHDGLLHIRISDDHGFVDADLHQLGQTGALLVARSESFVLPSVIGFPAEGGKAAGFVLNSIRTRHLWFDRISS